MRDYKFLSHSGQQVTVKAPDEPSARKAAMEKLWGPPQSLERPQPGTTDSYTTIGAGGYSGYGLMLQ